VQDANKGEFAAPLLNHFGGILNTLLCIQRSGRLSMRLGLSELHRVTRSNSENIVVNELAWQQLVWHNSSWVDSGSLQQSMRRIIAFSQYAIIGVIVTLLVGVVALSTATRAPLLQIGSGSWHTYKAGRLSESEQHESSVAEVAESDENVVAVAEASPPTHVPSEEVLPRALGLTVHRHHFRSPPSFS